MTLLSPTQAASLRASSPSSHTCSSCEHSDALLTFCTEKVHQIFILVPGTTAPVNMPMGLGTDGFIEARRTGRPPATAEPVSYWGNRSEPFMQGLQRIMEKAQQFSQPLGGQVHEYAGFSWSGFNSIRARMAAGAGGAATDVAPGQDLATTVIQQCAGWRGLNEIVWIHFIGHSHGGNVINECINASSFTDLLSAETKWKVKSVTYLSTPFFQSIHAPLSANLPEARAIRVFNSYDLTQRVIADFSVIDGRGHNLYYHAVTVIEAINRGIDYLSENFLQKLREVISAGASFLGYSIVSFITAGTVTSPAANAFVEFLNKCVEALQIVQRFVEIIRDGLSPLASYPGFDAVIAQVSNIITRVQALIALTMRMIHAEFTGGSTEDILRDYFFNYRDLISSINTLITHDTAVSGSIANGLVTMVYDLIQYFDNTSNNVSVYRRRGRSYGFSHVHNVDITTHDEVHGHRRGYQQFITTIEAIERRIQSSLEEVTLNPGDDAGRPLRSAGRGEPVFELLVTLIVNAVETPSWVDWLDEHPLLRSAVEHEVSSSVSAVLGRLDMLTAYADTIIPAGANQMVQHATDWIRLLKDRRFNMRKGIGYFATVSHGLSHERFFPEMEVELDKATGYFDLITANGGQPNLEGETLRYVQRDNPLVDATISDTMSVCMSTT